MKEWKGIFKQINYLLCIIAKCTENDLITRRDVVTYILIIITELKGFQLTGYEMTVVALLLLSINADTEFK